MVVLIEIVFYLLYESSLRAQLGSLCVAQPSESAELLFVKYTKKSIVLFENNCYAYRYLNSNGKSVVIRLILGIKTILPGMI